MGERVAADLFSGPFSTDARKGYLTRVALVLPAPRASQYRLLNGFERNQFEARVAQQIKHGEDEQIKYSYHRVIHAHIAQSRSWEHEKKAAHQCYHS